MPLKRRGAAVLLLLAAYVALPRPAYAQDSDPFGVWVGQFTCAQGSTDLTLTVGGKDLGNLQAFFNFYPAAGNPGLPEGCYTMSGRYDRVLGRLSLFADRWVLQPPNYVTVDLYGHVANNSFSGALRGPSCTSFDLHRLKASPHVPDPACLPSAMLRGSATKEGTEGND